MARQSEIDKIVLGEAPLEPRPLGVLDPLALEDGRGTPAEPEKVGPDDDEPPLLPAEFRLVSNSFREPGGNLLELFSPLAS